MDLLFATCEERPLATADDQILANALALGGVKVTPIPWTEIDPYSVIDSPPVLLRSTWDYHRKPTRFRSWLDAFANSGRRLWNAPEITRDNVDKFYLKNVEAAGIAIPQTRWLDRVDHESIAAIMRGENWTRAVLKPRIAATAYGTHMIDASEALDDDSLGPARASGGLLQEAIAEVATRGETSLVFVGGEFSHAVIKRANPGDFRVQKEFGGTVDVTDPTPSLRAFADRVMTIISGDCLYARVDVVETARGPLLMELELIEPELFFGISPESAHRMARILIDRLHTVG
jgi:glutathione synthase/RimK-type ligase-like ATP-grasp enzyme